MKKNIKLISVFATLVASLLTTVISINVLGEYGWTVFVFTPFLLGFLPPYIIGKTRNISRNESFSVSFITLLFSCLLLLIFAFEGLICIAMAFPILLLITWMGSYIGYRINRGNYFNSTNTVILLLTSSIGFMSFDYVNESEELIPVTTVIIVDAPIEEVWHNVVTFNKIDAPTDWIFTTGISYPTDATIEGKGVGAIRYCNFTTGSFVEPITTWNEPDLLQFDVIDQPTPMNEFNPFWSIHPPHLDGYFKSYKGQFKLTKINDNQTQLEGTTWYKVDIQPQIYWKTWSDFIIHRIHKRVLKHIKKVTEK